MGIHEDVEKEILTILKAKIVTLVSAMAGHSTAAEIASEVLKEGRISKKIDVERVTNELKMLAEDKKSEMSANVYEYIWNMMQRLEKDGVSK